MPGRHQRKIFASPIGTATPNAIYSQQAAKPECQEDINTKFSHLPIGTATPNTIYTQQAAKPRMPGRHQRKIFASPIGAATPNAIYTQQTAKPECQQDINANFSHLLLAQQPRIQFTHSKPPNPACQEDINAKCSHLLLAQQPRTQFNVNRVIINPTTLKYAKIPVRNNKPLPK